MTETLMQSLSVGYSALVIGASGGIGNAVSRQLEADIGCARVACLSRRNDGFEVTSEDSVRTAADRFASDSFDLIFCATGALTLNGVGPEKSLRQISRNTMMQQFAVNAVGPALILKHFVPLLSKKKRVIFALLSARVGSIGDNMLGGWISYRSSKAALNQIVRTAAIEVARTNPSSLIVAVHPGTVETELSAPFSAGHRRFQPDDAARRILRTLDGLAPDRTDGFFAYDGTSIAW
ncbi:SDR family NAD(P)-dependent oxidoreductase [Mycoplana ramosa]|uniref:SDR family NAD(P)-dependent oxidoreductase n=1 Tax=Mycoplana ramosa TaxID=40837 RepID=A0ABW3Z253_MYCRA